MLRVLCWSVAIASSLVFRAAPVFADLGMNDFRAMQGAWTLLYAEQGGGQLTYDMTGQGKMVVRGNGYWLGPQVPGAGKGQMVLNASRWPRQIDFTPYTGQYAGQTLRGIYEVNGDTQKVCFGAPGESRPMSFSTMPGTGQKSYVWLRIPNTSFSPSRPRVYGQPFEFETRQW
jgi:uncharacterized protein (TIGR03067 family)